MYSRVTILVVVVLVIGTVGLSLLGEASPVQGEAAHRTVWEGVYSAEQAASGAVLYDEYCARCHLSNLSGGGSDPPLAGPKWMDNWREDNLATLFIKIKTTMPRRQDKTLTEEEALQAVSFILQKNGFPEGAALHSDSLDDIQIEGKNGPQPLPNYALIEVVGCLTQEKGDWALTMVDRPRRFRDLGERPLEEVVKEASVRPMGERTLRLQNLILLGDFDPEAHQGQKMLARGALIRRSGAENVSVTNLDMVSESCGPGNSP